MRMPFFNKKKKVLCLTCKKNLVDKSRWNLPCEECRYFKRKTNIAVNSLRPFPAAVVTDNHGNRLFVDKFGREVDNPGYDLDNDPRGYKAVGMLPEKLDFI